MQTIVTVHIDRLNTVENSRFCGIAVLVLETDGGHVINELSSFFQNKIRIERPEQ